MRNISSDTFANHTNDLTPFEVISKNTTRSEEKKNRFTTRITRRIRRFSARRFRTGVQCVWFGFIYFFFF